MKAKYVIHTVGPVYAGRPRDAELLASCYRNSLDLARTYDIHTIAFPAISTGVYGYPLEEAVPIAVQTVRAWLAGHQDYPMTVVLCCFNQRTQDLYQRAVNEP